MTESKAGLDSLQREHAEAQAALKNRELEVCRIIGYSKGRKNRKEKVPGR